MKIYFDVPFFLTVAVLVSGLIALADVVYFSRQKHKSPALQIVFEYARSFFPMLLLVWGIRSFLIQPYRVPTGSLEPTILPGDFIVVNQFAYGIRLPVLNTKIVNIGEPKRGDIALFRFPKDPGTLFVKRVIGLPGDHVAYKNKILTINGKKMEQSPLGMDLDLEGAYPMPVQVKLEKLEQVEHKIFIRSGVREWENVDITVPENCYFMMGDNRDSSADGRMWGFVPEANLIGKVFGIWLSWDSGSTRVRWSRIGNKVI